MPLRRLATYLALPILILAACTTPPPPPSGNGFTIEATPGTVATLADETLQISVTVTGTTGGAVILDLANLAPGMSVQTPVSLPEGTAAGTLDLIVGPDTALGTTTVTVTAAGPDASATDSVDVTVDPTPGSVDLGYGTDGRVDFPNGINSSESGIVGIDFDSAGNAVIAFAAYNGDNNDFGVARIFPDGTLDPTFGTDGWVRYDGGDDRDDNPVGVVVNDDGTIVVAGSGRTATSLDEDLLAMRLTSSGALDAGFGTGGIATAAFGDSADAVGMGVDSDGRIVVVGREGCCSGTDVLVARFDAAGALDPTFDADGLLTLDIDGGSGDRPEGVAIDASDRIVIVGSVEDTTPTEDAFILRLTVAGAVDPAFSGGAPLIFDVAESRDRLSAVRIDALDRIVAIGYAGFFGANEDTLMVRVDNAGNLDTGFGTGGFATTDVVGGYDELLDLDIAPDGDIVAVGYYALGPFPAGFAARYDSDGTLDSGFNKDGLFLQDSNDFGVFNTVAIDNDGSYLVAGGGFGLILTKLDPTP